MRIAVSKGHNVYNSGVFDNGASGNGFKEATEVDKAVDILIVMLRSQGHYVEDVTPKNQHFKNSKEAHQERAKRVNQGNFDMYLDVHLNAGGGTGPEMWVYSPRGLSYDYARKIVTNMVEDTKLKNRGVKVKPTMWSLAMTNCPSIIVEGGFIDSKIDMDIITPELYAKSIARAFGEVKEDKEIEIEKETDKSSLYKVQVGAYSVKGNAEKMLEDLKSAGFNGYIKQEDVNVKEDIVKKKSKYYKIGDAQIIETTPDNIYIDVIGDTLHNKKVFGVNGVLYDTDTAPVTSPNSCVFIAMSKGKAISDNAQFNGYKGPPRATLIYQNNKLLGFRQLTNINPIRSITEWALGGYMVKPYMDFKNEQIPGSVNYRTAHTYIGYDEKGKVYLIVKPNHMIADIVPLLNQIGITNCIVLDGGGSSQLNHPDGYYRSSRKINTAVLLKEV